MNNQPPWHFGAAKKYAGQTLSWLYSDTEQSFRTLIQTPEYAEYFATKGWLDPSAITYQINSHGFRSSEFDSDAPNMIALGCSYTFGSGLPLQSVWPSLVANQLDLHSYNLAWPGTSADTCFMLAQYWIPRLRPRLVVMAAPPRHRFDLITEDPDTPHETYLPAHEIGADQSSDYYVQNWFLHDRNADLNNARNKLAIQGLCAELGIPCLTYNAHEYFARSREEVEYARDRMHAGPRGHTMFAERILNDYPKKS